LVDLPGSTGAPGGVAKVVAMYYSFFFSYPLDAATAPATIAIAIDVSIL
jgi:hypothetical protein